MSRTKTLLVSWGRGNGHITRLLELGTACATDGSECVVVGHNVPLHDQMIARRKFAVVHYPAEMDNADPWISWKDPNFLAASVAFDRVLIREHQPSRVVNDNRLSTLIAAAAERVPIVTICQDNQTPGFRYGQDPIASIWVDSLPAINAVLAALKMGSVQDDARNLFGLGRIAIPSTPTLEPVSNNGKLDIVHLGMLTALVPDPVVDAKDLMFYRTVGSIDAEFVSAFTSWPGDIYVATGEADTAEQLRGQDHKHRFAVQAMWDWDDIGPNLRAVVHHGGHGTTSTCISGSVPAVILPGHNPERQANAARAKTLGLAQVMLPPEPCGLQWGPAVDVTGDRPPWARVREGVDRLAVRSLSTADRNKSRSRAEDLAVMLR